ncbi:MAG: ATP-binding protein [archaeon]
MIPKDLKNFFEYIVNSFRESFLVLDSDMRILYANDSFYKTFKVNTKETENKRIYDLGNKQWDIPKLKELLEHILPQKTTIEGFEVMHNFPVIGKKTMLINAREIIDGTNKKVLLVIEDITERKKALEYTIQKAKLSSIGQLSAGIAHGLNSPITGIHNFLNVYFKEEKKGTEKYNELKLMLNGCEYMTAITKNLTYFASENNNQFNKVNVIEVIESVLLFIERQLMSYNIKVIRDFPNELNEIVGNKAQLQHVFLNILMNSMEAIEGHGNITIKARETADKSVILEFTDTGKGISKEDLPRVFEPFFTTKKDSGGSGLGLSSAHDIITNHKGLISIKSEKGKGTIVTLSIPLTQKE